MLFNGWLRSHRLVDRPTWVVRVIRMCLAGSPGTDGVGSGGVNFTHLWRVCFTRLSLTLVSFNGMSPARRETTIALAGD